MDVTQVFAVIGLLSVVVGLAKKALPAMQEWADKTETTADNDLVSACASIIGILSDLLLPLMRVLEYAAMHRLPALPKKDGK